MEVAAHEAALLARRHDAVAEQPDAAADAQTRECESTAHVHNRALRAERRTAEAYEYSICGTSAGHMQMNIPTGAREHVARHVRRAARRVVPLGHLLAVVPTHGPLRDVVCGPLVRRSRRRLRAVPARDRSTIKTQLRAYTERSSA